MLAFLLCKNKKKQKQHQKDINLIPPRLKFSNMCFTTASCHVIKKAHPGIYFIKCLRIA